MLGLMGSGKTTVGTQLAARLGRTFADNDHLLEARIGATARQFQLDHGADALHAEERAAFLEALSSPAEPGLVLAGAASLADDADDVAPVLAERAVVVWLDVPVAELARRVTADVASAHRPFAGAVDAVLEEQAARRRTSFVRLADVTVDASVPVDRIVEAVLSA